MTPERITCFCPKCRAKYRVLPKAAGHHAQCRMCGQTFRVIEVVARPPTEDDILRWLGEAEERDEASTERWPDDADAAAPASIGDLPKQC